RSNMNERTINLGVGESVVLEARGYGGEDNHCLGPCAAPKTTWSTASGSVVKLDYTIGAWVKVTALAPGEAGIRAEHPVTKVEVTQETVEEKLWDDVVEEHWPRSIARVKQGLTTATLRPVVQRRQTVTSDTIRIRVFDPADPPALNLLVIHVKGGV